MSDRRVRAYLGLGANLGDPDATLAEAIRDLAAVDGLRLRGVSRLYATAPVGLADQPEFRNAVVAVDVRLPADREPAAAALDLLLSLKAMERAAGRRAGPRWGPRELDLDLLVFGRTPIRLRRPPAGRSIDPVKSAGPDADLLRIPHPEARERAFVLAPLADLVPRLVPPGWGETVASAARRRLAADGPEAARAIAGWDPERRRWRPLPGAR